MDYKINTLLNYQPRSLSLDPGKLKLDIVLLDGLQIHCKEDWQSGQPSYFEYFTESDGKTYSNKVFQEDFEFVRNQTGRLLRKITRTRYILLGSETEYGDHVKEEVEYFSEKQADDHDCARRATIISGLITSSKAFGLSSELNVMLRDLAAYRNTYVEANDRELINQIQSYDVEWLDASASESSTLREAIIEALDYTDVVDS